MCGMEVKGKSSMTHHGPLLVQMCCMPVWRHRIKSHEMSSMHSLLSPPLFLCSAVSTVFHLSWCPICSNYYFPWYHVCSTVYFGFPFSLLCLTKHIHCSVILPGVLLVCHAVFTNSVLLSVLLLPPLCHLSWCPILWHTSYVQNVLSIVCSGVPTNFATMWPRVLPFSASSVTSVLFNNDWNLLIFRGHFPRKICLKSSIPKTKC